MITAGMFIGELLSNWSLRPTKPKGKSENNKENSVSKMKEIFESCKTDIVIFCSNFDYTHYSNKELKPALRRDPKKS